MCQLLAMNCNVPTDICFSFAGFKQRGGKTDEHGDGWGIAFFEGKGVRQFLDSSASAHSPIAELVKTYPIKSKNVISHIRKATQGVVNLENTHPFMRELWGNYWIFAHNGNLENYQNHSSIQLGNDFQPVGNTDSEFAFCYLMQSLKNKFGPTKPDAAALFSELVNISKLLGNLGEFNFLFSNGESLFAHCSTHLQYIIRKAPFTMAQLSDEDVTVDFGTITTPNDIVAVIATDALTHNEKWTVMEPGTLWMFQEGQVVKFEKTTLSPVDRANSKEQTS